MAKAFISFEKESGSFLHNTRDEKIEPEYLLPKEYRLGNLYSCSFQEANEKLRFMKEEAFRNYRATFKQKLVTKNFKTQAVVIVEKDHTLEDVERLALAIEKETGFRTIQIAIHKDEGSIQKNENGKEFVKYNFHAHIDFFTLDSKTGAQLNNLGLKPSQSRELKRIEKEENRKLSTNEIDKLFPTMNRRRMSKFQDMTAEVLNMKRGESAEITKKKRLRPSEYRQEQKQKEQLEYTFRDMQKEITNLQSINSEQKKELHRLNSQIRNQKDIDVKDKQIKELKDKLHKAQTEIEEIDKITDDIDIELSSLEEPKSIEKTKTVEQKKQLTYIGKITNIISSLFEKLKMALTENQKLREENERLKQKRKFGREELIKEVRQHIEDELENTETSFLTSRRKQLEEIEENFIKEIKINKNDNQSINVEHIQQDNYTMHPQNI